ncbi:hypothetical protein GCM10027285_06230 [Oleiagrimonas citrea]
MDASYPLGITLCVFAKYVSGAIIGMIVRDKNFEQASSVLREHAVKTVSDVAFLVAGNDADGYVTNGHASPGCDKSMCDAYSWAWGDV